MAWDDFLERMKGEKQSSISLAVSDNDSEFTRFMQHSEKSLKDFNQWKADVEQFIKLQEGMGSEEMRKKVAKMMEEDAVFVRPVSDLMSEMAGYRREKVQSDLLRVFKTVFRGMRSITKPVAKYGSGEKSAICIGKNGFGLRHNIMSMEIQRFDEVVKICAARVEIVESLQKMKMHAWAEKFEKFCQLVPDMEQFKSGEYSFKLSPKVLMPVSDRKNLAEHQHVADMLNVEWYENGYNRSAEIRFQLSYDGSYGRSSESIEYVWKVDDWKDLKYDDVIMYLQLRSQLQKICKDVEKQLTEQLVKVRVMFEEFKKAFGRELLLAEL